MFSAAAVFHSGVLEETMGSNGRYIGTPTWVREFGVWVRKPRGRFRSKYFAYMAQVPMWRTRPARPEPCDKHRRKRGAFTP